MASQPSPSWLYEDELTPDELERLRTATTAQREREAVAHAWKTKVRRLLVAAGVGALTAFIALLLVGSYTLLQTSPRVREAVVNLVRGITPERQAKRIITSHPPARPPMLRSGRELSEIRDLPEIRKLGKLEVYVLNGDEYILVKSNGKVALMDVKTGTIRWLPETGIPPAQAAN